MKSSVDIIVVSNKHEDELAPQMCELETKLDAKGFVVQKIIKTCKRNSAAFNRNYGISQADSEYGIMIDDDIFGFYQGWIDDLLEPHLASKDKFPKYISARLVKPDGSPAIMMDGYRDMETPLIKTNLIPTSAVCFPLEMVRGKARVFNIDYIGSGFEDTQFCLELKERGIFPYINNRCRLVHLNEMKNQKDEFWFFNRMVFKRWQESTGIGMEVSA